MPDDRERRIAVEAEQMMRLSRTRERHKLLLFGAAASFGLAVLAGGVLSPVLFPILLGISGVLFILAGRDARKGGYVATPVSFSVSIGGVGVSDDDDVDTRTLEDMPASQYGPYVQGAGLKLYAFGALAIAAALFTAVIEGVRLFR